MLSIFDQGPPSPCPEPFNMAAHVLAHAEDAPDKLALAVLGSEEWTYRDLKAAVLGTATGLLETGAVAGDRILMRLGNTVDFPIAYLGAIAAGLVPVPTASALTDREVAPMIETLAPAAILHDPAVACPTDQRIIGLDRLRAMRNLPAADWHMGDPERPAYIIYTSGTSGSPRAVVHAHRAIWARLMMHDGWYGLRSSDRVLHAGAFNWTYTLGTGLMDPWTIGATALIPAVGTQAPDLPNLIAQHDATIFAAAPGVYRQLLDQPDLPAMPVLRHGLSAGEKLPPAVCERWERATGTPVFEAYGMSECSTFISGAPDHPAPTTVLGRPQKGRRIAVLGPDGPVPLETEGTIAVHRSDPGLMLGYLDAPEETAAKMQGEWFLTGDQGSMDGDFQITYLGRNDDMMNAGGFRVSPVEVEACLARFEGISAVGVAEVNVKQDVSVIAAFYTAAAPLDEEALHSYAQDNLARYKQPRLYIHLPQLPMGANGKILRRALRQHYEASR
ncbi:class I adenylate-forming enzyme family protein [Sulfitobacter sp. F26169L]|uniref:class I adenylate-forming enzyme family protein n=1 Tax=Sulfitobacter sp. F26169L TaxID=2996015 RepID=UPI002260D14C|nr:class I adenylate-forming enzyme family protein [Sulfitobacter sp. F26169L]MCX7565399.1 class I adenylate-forming enzyme family protein [Sulfitobacter sp. F26169L]